MLPYSLGLEPQIYISLILKFQQIPPNFVVSRKVFYLREIAQSNLFSKVNKGTVLAESCRGFLLQQCLNGTRLLVPPYPGRPLRASPRHHLTAPSDRPKVPATAPAPLGRRRHHHHHHHRPFSAAHHDDRIPLAGAPELPPGLGGRHQPPDQPRALCLLCLPVHVILS